MRVTQNQIYNPYLNNLEKIMNRKFKSEMRLSTGEKIVTSSDSVKEFVNVKGLSSLIGRNQSYLGNIEDTLNEVYSIDEQLNKVADVMEEIRVLAIESSQAGNAGNLFSIGVYVRGLLEDLVKDANYSFNGHYLFSGTKTTGQSLTPVPPAVGNMPFEIISEAPTADNWSGLRVVFKGNNEDRTIHKDDTSTEVINVKAEEIFGGDGTEIFEDIIKLYNMLTYNPDGTARSISDVFNIEDIADLNEVQKNIAVQTEEIFNTVAQNGALMNRLDTIRLQMEEESLRLKEFRSQDKDTDYAEASMELAKDDSALRYSLQVGSRISQYSLFDFLR